VPIAKTFLVVLLMFASAPVHADSPKQVMAYYETAGSYAALQSFYSYMNQMPTDTIAVDSQGNMTGTAPAPALTFAKSKGMLTFAAVSNFGANGFDGKIAHAVLTIPSVRARTISNMMKVVERSSYDGINIDFEAIEPTDRKAFSFFVHTVAQKMRAKGWLTVVSAPAELKDDPQDSWTGAFDFKALGKDTDILQLMTYDQNGPWGPPGPVAGLNWVEPCVRYTVSVMASSKVSLGLPAYGYDWNTTKHTGVQVFWKNIPTLIANTGAKPEWDPVSSSPFFTYQSPDGARHVVWYEDTTSIPLKSALAVTYNLAGVSAFALGFDDLSFWQAVHAGGF